MTKKHFVAISESLRQTKPHDDASEEVKYQWRLTVRELSLTFRQFNSAFNRSTFLEACGYEDEN